MEPLEIGLMAIATTLVHKAVETTGEKVTESALDTILPRLKTAIATFPPQLRDRIVWLGHRVHQRLPVGTQPANNPVLIAEIVKSEAQDPEFAAAVSDVTEALPNIEIKIDQRKQQGIVIDGQSTGHFHEKIDQTFS